MARSESTWLGILTPIQVNVPFGLVFSCQVTVKFEVISPFTTTWLRGGVFYHHFWVFLKNLKKYPALLRLFNRPAHFWAQFDICLKTVLSRFWWKSSVSIPLFSNSNYRSISPVPPLRTRDLLAFWLSNLPGKPEGSRIADYEIMSGNFEIPPRRPIRLRCSSQKYHYDFVSVIASLGVQPRFWSIPVIALSRRRSSRGRDQLGLVF